MNNIKLGLYPLAVLLMASCVTINVYFPAAAAQQAADEIVNEVLNQGNMNRKPQEEPNSTTEAVKPDTSYQQNINTSVILVNILDFIVPLAQAGANLAINTPKILSLRSQLKQQHSHIEPYLNKGNMGYADNGLIKIRTTAGLNIKHKSTMKKLVNTSNSILSNLYHEIAKANAHPEWKSDIQKMFAKTWISQMRSGWMYYSGGVWKKK